MQRKPLAEVIELPDIRATFERLYSSIISNPSTSCGEPPTAQTA